MQGRSKIGRSALGWEAVSAVSTESERKSEMQCAGMANRHRARLRRPARADLAERRLHLVNHEIDHMKRAFRAECAETPQERFSGKRSIRAERDRPHHIEPRTDPAVDHHGYPAANGASNGGKYVHGRRQALDLPSAVVGDDDAVDPKRHAPFRVGRMKKPLHHQWRFPALPVPSDLLPGEGAGHLASNKRRDLVHIGRVAGIAFKITEARLTVLP